MAQYGDDEPSAQLSWISISPEIISHAVSPAYGLVLTSAPTPDIFSARAEPRDARTKWHRRLQMARTVLAAFVTAAVVFTLAPQSTTAQSGERTMHMRTPDGHHVAIRGVLVEVDGE